MSHLQELKDTLPAYAKDTKLNISQVLKSNYSEGLSQKQIYTTALSCAYALKDKSLVEAFLEEAKGEIEDQDLIAAKAAASLMAMNNIYYRFIHLSDDKDFSKRPAKLRMNFMSNPGVEKIDFEIYSLAVSSLSGCGMCINSHVKLIKNNGLGDATIQSIARIAAVVNAFSTSLTLD